MAEEATETPTTPTTETPASAPTPDPAPSAPDVSEQIQALRDEYEQRFDEIEAERWEPEEEGLLGYDEDGQPVYADEEDPEAEGELDPEEMEPEEALRAFVQQEAQQIAQAAVEPLQERWVMERRQEALSDFAEEYRLPREESGEVKREVIDAIADQLSPIAEQYGPGVYTDPELVKRAWLAHLAEEESASEVPAEEASRAGAVLETGAGPGGSGQAKSEEDQIKREIMATGGPGGTWV